MKQFRDYESIPEDYVPVEELVAVGYGRNRWVEILSVEAVAPETGLYIVACRGDNHLTWELHRYEKGERLWKFFEGGNAHEDGWFTVEPLAYHFVPEFSADEQSWKAFNPQDEINTFGIAVFALRKNGEISYKAEEVGPFYRQKRWGEFFGARSVEIIAIYGCVFKYTEDRHSRHWEMFNKRNKGSEG